MRRQRRRPIAGSPIGGTAALVTGHAAVADAVIEARLVVQTAAADVAAVELLLVVYVADGRRRRRWLDGGRSRRSNGRAAWTERRCMVC